MKHYKDCPENKGYDCCTCDMCGEDTALIEWQIKKQEGTLPWWNIVAKLSLACFGPGEILKVEGK